MSRATFYIGDTLAITKTLPDGSVDLVLTSPPFLALRSYLPADHPDKDKEIGAEPTPADFIDTLLTLTAEWRRVLGPHGSIAVELGDTYSGSGGAGGDYGPAGMRKGQPAFNGSAARASRAWPLAKSLCHIPELYRVALAYGINPLTGNPSPAGKWRVRNVVRWFRPNPPVGALGDKFRPATSDMVIACTSGNRYFDLDAVRTPLARDYTNETPTKPNREADRQGTGRKNTVREQVANPDGAPPLDTWTIPTQPYKGSHYAVWPQELLTKPIKAMSPPGGTVLDPFAGSGTTLQVATGHGRNAIGIDIDERNADLARERVGMFLDVVDTRVAQ